MKTRVLIIGAGPYGISLFNELTRQNIGCLIVGSPFSLWMNHMIARLNLRSNIMTSEIYSIDDRFSWKRYFESAGMDVKLDKFLRIPVSWFQNYARWVLGQLPDIIDDKVSHLSHENGLFVAITESGIRIESEKVVIATGIGEHLFMPLCLKELSNDLVVHSYDTKKYENSENKEILVIGGGQSAADTLVALSPENKITWVHRNPVIYYHEPLNIPQPVFNIIHRLTPLFYYFPRMINKLFAGKFTSPTIDPIVKEKIVYKNVCEIQSPIEELKLQACDGKIISNSLQKSFDQVIACTGYHFQLSTFRFLEQPLKDRIIVNDSNIPLLKWQFETTVPGLFMIGGISEFSHGPAARFMMGCRQTTLNVSRALC